MKTYSSAVLIMILLLVISSCSVSRQMATTRNISNAENLFLSEQPSPDYTFYYYGRIDQPIALLALDKNYSINSEFWTITDINETHRQKWQYHIENSYFRYGSYYKGKEIVSKQSATIGVVLSRYHWITAWFEEGEDTRVIIPPPELSTTQPDRDRLYRN